jgi:hypothetical protein
MSRLKGTISISRPQGIDWNDEFCITIRDDKSRAQFLEIKIGAKELALALSNLSDQPMEYKARALKYLGKNTVLKTIVVQLPNDVDYNERPKLAKRLAEMEVVGTDWIISDYFGSKESFFTKDGQNFARARASTYMNDEDYAIYLKNEGDNG